MACSDVRYFEIAGSIIEYRESLTTIGCGNCGRCIDESVPMELVPSWGILAWGTDLIFRCGLNDIQDLCSC